MKALIILLLFFVVGVIGSSQIRVSGYLSDCKTGERLIGANIYDKTTGKGTVTNAFGFFSIKFPKQGSVTLRFSYIGYETKEILFAGINDTTVNVCLVPGKEIGEVKVTGHLNIEDKPEIGKIDVPLKQIRDIPALGGEPDVMKALQLLPGVQAGDEGTSGIYVRGGSPDQNLMLLDDVPLYYVNHLGGFVSTFNVDALSNVTLYKGGFPARYGSRLSSVVDIRMKDGNMKKFHGAGTIGMITTKLMVEGPIIKDRLSYLISARRFMYDLLMRPITRISFKGVSTGYTFYDVNAKVNYIANQNNRLYLSFYGGDDNLVAKIHKKEYEQKAKTKLQWGNLLGAFRWNHTFSPNLFSNTTVTYTRYRYRTFSNSEIDSIKSEYEFLSAIRDVNAKFDLEYYPLNALKVRAGLNGIIHKYIPTSTSYSEEINDETIKDTTYNEFNQFAYEWNAYVENEIRIGRSVSANLGLRYSAYSINDTTFSGFEPRLLLNVKFAPHTSFKAAYSYMQQYVHLLTSAGEGMSADYWVPTTRQLVPEVSSQYSAGLAHTQKAFEISLETYYKKMNDLISFTEGVAYLNGSGDWQSKVDKNGLGTSYGVEVLIKKKTGRLTGWTGYTWSKTTRQFENQNNGKPYPFKYDRRNNFSITGSYRINDHINVSATWVYGTGNPVTLPVAHHYVIDENDDTYYDSDIMDKPFSLYEGYDYGGKNSIRMRDYHRLDVGVNFTKKKRWGERTWNISVYNLYNRQNPYYYEYDYKQDTSIYVDGKPVQRVDKTNQLYQYSLFPFMPSISYSFKF